MHQCYAQAIVFIVSDAPGILQNDTGKYFGQYLRLGSSEPPSCKFGPEVAEPLRADAKMGS